MLRHFGFPPDSHSGKDLLCHPGNLPARRAVPDRRGRTCSKPRRASCACRNAAAPGSSCARTSTDVLCPRWSSCRATATPPRSACGSRTNCRHLQRRVHRLRGPDDRVRAGPPVLPDPAAQGRRDRRRRRRRAGDAAGQRRPILVRGHRRGAAREVRAGVQAEQLSAHCGPRPSRRTTGWRSRSRTRWRTSPALRSSTRPTEARTPEPAPCQLMYVYLPRRQRRTAPRARTPGSSCTWPSRKSLTQILPFLHNLGLEVLDERPFEIETADRRRASSSTTWACATAPGIDPLDTGTLLAEAFRAASPAPASPTPWTG